MRYGVFVKRFTQTAFGTFGGIALIVYVVGCHTCLGAYDVPTYSRRLDSLMAKSKALGIPHDCRRARLPSDC